MERMNNEDYLKMKEEDLLWAKDVLGYQTKKDNHPGVKYLKNDPITDLKDMINLSARKYPNNAAFYEKFDKGGTFQKITYTEFLDDINGLGTALIDLGLKDKRIAVIGENSYMWSTSYMAILCGTGIMVPLDKELPYDDIKNLLNEAEVSCVIFDSKREDTFVKIYNEHSTKLEILISKNRQEKKDNILSFWELKEYGKKLIKDGNREFLDAQINARDMAEILFTSGTTGLAKGIMISHRNLCADIMVASSVLFVSSHEIFFSILPLHHTYECTSGFLQPMYAGAAIAHCEGLKYIVKNLQEVHPTFFLCVPAILEALNKNIWKGIAKKGKTDTVKKAMKISDSLRKVGINLTKKLFKEIHETLGGNLRMIIVGGAAINPEILDNFKSFGINSLQGYGLTECAPMGALNPDTMPKSKSIGVALPSTEIKIDNPDDEGVGEILIKGPNVMLGYYKRPELTAETIVDGYFHSGDLGYIDNDGYIYITGRRKNVIITKNGKNVFPEELEYELSNYDEVMESMVFEDESENKDDTVIVAGIYPDYSMFNDMSDEDIKKRLWEIVDEINKKNPGYKMIRKINLRHTEFTKNTSRKIKRFVPENKMEI